MSGRKLAPCPLWGGGTQYQTTGDYHEIENPRAGGRYRISRNALVTLERSYTPLLAAKLTTWIIDHHRLGEEVPMITTKILAEVDARPAITFSQQQHRFFLFLIQWRFRAGASLRIYGNEDEEYTRDRAQLSAWTECESDGELNDFVRLLVQDDLVELVRGRLHLAPDGFRKLEQVQTSSRDSTQAFVAMWFDPSLKSAFDDGFEPAIVAAGYKAMRIDRKEHINKIDDEIIAEIRRSKFVVADMTCGKIGDEWISRGGVYFEAGYAMGLQIPVIWCCREDCRDSMHFDTRQFAHVLWKDEEDLKLQLYNKIAAVIGEGPGAPGLHKATR